MEYRNSPADGQAPWLKDCITENGKPLPILANAIIGIEHEWPNAFVYDEISCAPALVRAVDGDNDFKPRPVADDDVGVIQQRLQHFGLKRISKDVCHQAIAVIAARCRYHPVRDYLDSLSWDGAARAGKLFTTYFGSPSYPAYAEATARMFLIALIARIYEPGCKADYVPVIEGSQGTFKSTALRILGGEWFDDALPDVSCGKEVQQYLRGKWLIEVSEMHAMGRAEVSHLKAFITRQQERYRPPYGRLEVIEKRQCIFCGTTNKETYLRDETGNRRFWPIKSGIIDLDALARDRDQLFAEAVSLYRAGIPWWPDRDFEHGYIVPEQQSRYEADPWEEGIRNYLAQASESWRRGGRVTIGQIAENVLKLDRKEVGTSHQRRIAGVLTQIGWQRERVGGDGKRWWSRI
jgi:predicted P-loop ATPase